MPDETADPEVVYQPETPALPENPPLTLIITSWILFAIIGLPSLMMAVMIFDSKLRLNGPDTYLVVGWIRTAIFFIFTGLVVVAHLAPNRSRS